MCRMTRWVGVVRHPYGFLVVHKSLVFAPQSSVDGCKGNPGSCHIYLTTEGWSSFFVPDLQMDVFKLFVDTHIFQHSKSLSVVFLSVHYYCLSAGRIRISSLFFNCFNACDSRGWRFGVNRGGLLSTPNTLDLACDTELGSAFEDFKAVSMLAMIFGIGTRLGVGEKLRPFDRTDFCSSVMVVEERFTIQRYWFTDLSCFFKQLLEFLLLCCFTTSLLSISDILSMYFYSFKVIWS